MRKRFKGRMVRPSGEPRSQHVDKMPAPVKYECGQDQPYGTKHIPGRFRVELPHGRIRYVRLGV